MKWIRRILFLYFLPLFLILFLFLALFSSGNSGSSSYKEDGVEYVEHWSNGDAYSHDLLKIRYGITAEQIDGYLDSLNISYDKSRINGKLLLEWQKASGLDVRAIVAIALNESSLGTAGVATKKGANMFGYGAYDSNPDHATKFSDEIAVIDLTKITIIQNKNESFKIQDEKAKKNANGTLNTATEGGVYFTDTSGSGKRRAETMEKLDQFIDEHGGTPKSKSKKSKNKNNVASGTLADSFDLPKGYENKFDLGKPKNAMTTQAGSGYPVGQCTWYAYNRLIELNLIAPVGYGFLGNGQDWTRSLVAKGWKYVSKPEKGAVLSIQGGVDGTIAAYGHVAIVEHVNPDGTFLISECNWLGVQDKIHYRVVSVQSGYSFAVKK